MADFLQEKISDVLTVEQKIHRVRNLLQEMRRDGVIAPSGQGQGALWELAKPGGESSDLANPYDGLGTP